ncbi:hypothetical protein [Hydrogenobaculum acidophilum]
MEHLNYSKFNRIFLAGKDKGNLEKELENILISVKVLYKGYMVDIDSMDKDDIMYDYEEHKHTYENVIRPFLSKKEILADKKLCEKANSISELYEKFLDTLEKRLSTF